VNTFLVITSEPIDETALASARAASVTSGAVVTFRGVVRGVEDGRPIQGIRYEAFEEMARSEFGKLFEEAGRRWPLESIRLVHRIGPVAAGDASLWVEVAAPHRGEALAACGWIIDEMKRRVPVWKRPY
jgi:molybdopterin synthase catalytic subunit